MKKLLFALLLLLIPMAALAEGGIALDEDRALQGMERSWAQGYEPTNADGYVSVWLPLVSDSAYGKLKATLIPDDPAATPFRKQDMSVSFSRNEAGVYPVKLRLRLLSDYRNGDYPCRILAEGKDREGNPLSLELPLLLRIRGGRDGYAELRPEIEDVEADLRAGEACPLTVRVSNPYPDIEMRDVLLTVSEEGEKDSAEVMCEDSEVIPAGTLAPGASAELEVSMRVLPTASIGLHSLKFKLDFTALDARHTWEQSFNLPVSQEMRLEQGGLQMADSAIQGDTASLTLPLMNMGRTELRNACATLMIPGMVERQSVLVGVIPSGEAKQAKLTWSVPRDGTAGDYSGQLVVTAEDEWGNATGFELPVALAVEARPAEESAVEHQPFRAKDEDGLVYALAGLSLLLLAALAVQGAVLRSRLRKVEEGRL